MNVISIEQLIEEWNKDSVIDETEPGKELLKIPKLHAKYVSQITAHSIALKMKELEYRVLRKRKVEYYSGRMDQKQLQELGLEPFRFVLKQDLSTYMDADPELIALERKQISNREAIAFCQSVAKELSSRTYALRGHIDWEKFIAGS
jgi:hypothetical protein